MGFSSTFISEDFHGNLPDWFTEEWQPRGLVISPSTLMISTAYEVKDSWINEIMNDYQKALIEVGLFDRVGNIRVVVMSGTGSITRIDISRDKKTFHHAELDLDVDDECCRAF